MARGRWGQFIFVIPEHDMVVVALGDAKAPSEQNRPIQVMYDRILPAVRR
jgi:CubicO group peptidase (beta-lactamase class C family)